LVALLYLIYKICVHHTITSGQVTVYCDNVSALNTVFYRNFRGINQFTASDHDLVTNVQDLINLLPITVKHVWVKGHSNSKNPTLPEKLNDLADNLAKSYTENPPHAFKPRSLTLAPPNYRQ
jgi:ribonuclease HI